MIIEQHKVGQEIQVGDYIVIQSRLDNKYKPYRVHRVTANFVFIRWNEISEGKFPRTYTGKFSFQPAGHKDKFSTVNYIAGKEKGK
jgi:hypothetical protein